ncbi:MAG TPA: PHP domain-containing protein [Streptosporangiaceae bacterium]|nr:PHP domain-containing protein [Streptosporangiaceae bacterium]
MTIQIPLDEDHHVHSRFSDDAVSTLDQNVAAARQRGLRVLCLAEHVRGDSDWLPGYLAAVEALRPVPGLAVVAGVEAKILDRTGQLDLPGDAAGADRVLIADHQFPGALGPVHPREVRDALTAGSVTEGEVVSGLIEATAGALERAARPQLAHLFSILPKMGIPETAVSDTAIGHLAGRAAAAGAMLEVNEKWACPSPRTVRAFAAAGVPLVASTDSHDCRDIGVYSAVRELAAGISPDPVR